jgi:DNA-binding MarR family transcriptional regulator
MHATFFATKRAFHGILRMTRRPLACFGLTPARFDMLYVMYARMDHRCLQSAIRRALGVTAATVSKMLRSLQALGLVKRQRWSLDGRERMVELTQPGLRLMQAAHDELVASGAAELALDCALAYPKQHVRSACGRATRILDRFLERMRIQFRDSAFLSYKRVPECLLADPPTASLMGIPIKYRFFWDGPRPAWHDLLSIRLNEPDEPDEPDIRDGRAR